MFSACVKEIEAEKITALRPVRLHGAESAEIWLERLHEENGNIGLYLVNGSDKILSLVTTGIVSAVTLDENFHGGEKEGHSYHNLKPGEAAKLDEYDGFYDLDYLLTTHLTIIADHLGTIEFCPPPKKGGLGRQGLLWVVDKTKE